MLRHGPDLPSSLDLSRQSPTNRPTTVPPGRSLGLAQLDTPEYLGGDAATATLPGRSASSTALTVPSNRPGSSPDMLSSMLRAKDTSTPRVSSEPLVIDLHALQQPSSSPKFSSLPCASVPPEMFGPPPKSREATLNVAELDASLSRSKSVTASPVAAAALLQPLPAEAHLAPAVSREAAREVLRDTTFKRDVVAAAIYSAIPASQRNIEVPVDAGTDAGRTAIHSTLDSAFAGKSVMDITRGLTVAKPGEPQKRLDPPKAALANRETLLAWAVDQAGEGYALSFKAPSAAKAALAAADLAMASPSGEVRIPAGSEKKGKAQVVSTNTILASAHQELEGAAGHQVRRESMNQGALTPRSLAFRSDLLSGLYAFGDALGQERSRASEPLRGYHEMMSNDKAPKEGPWRSIFSPPSQSTTLSLIPTPTQPEPLSGNSFEVTILPARPKK